MLWVLVDEFELVGVTEKWQFHRCTMGLKLSPSSVHPMVPRHRASATLGRKGLHWREGATREPVLREELIQHGCIMMQWLLHFEHVGMCSNLRFEGVENGFANFDVQRTFPPRKKNFRILALEIEG